VNKSDGGWQPSSLEGPPGGRRQRRVRWRCGVKRRRTPSGGWRPRSSASRRSPSGSGRRRPGGGRQRKHPCPPCWRPIWKFFHQHIFEKPSIHRVRRFLPSISRSIPCPRNATAARGWTIRRRRLPGSGRRRQRRPSRTRRPRRRSTPPPGSGLTPSPPPPPPSLRSRIACHLRPRPPVEVDALRTEVEALRRRVAEVPAADGQATPGRPSALR